MKCKVCPRESTNPLSGLCNLHFKIKRDRIQAVVGHVAPSGRGDGRLIRKAHLHHYGQHRNPDLARHAACQICGQSIPKGRLLQYAITHGAKAEPALRRWTMWQLANDRETYGEFALAWIVITDDREGAEVSGPMTHDVAEQIVADHNREIEGDAR